MKGVNDSNINDYIDNVELVVIKFTADWCGSCSIIENSLNEIEEEYKKVCFLKANVEYCEETCEKFGIMSLPVVVILKNGNEVSRVIGAKPKHVYEEEIAEHAVDIN